MSECVLSFTREENEPIELKPHTKNFDYYNNLLRLSYDEALTVVKHANNPYNENHNDSLNGCPKFPKDYELHNYYDKNELLKKLDKYEKIICKLCFGKVNVEYTGNTKKTPNICNQCIASKERDDNPVKRKQLAKNEPHCCSKYKIDKLNTSNTRTYKFHIHHDREDKVLNLSNIHNCYDVGNTQTAYAYQEIQNLTYADLIEHAILHTLIYRKTIHSTKPMPQNKDSVLGINGGIALTGKIEKWFYKKKKCSKLVWSIAIPIESILNDKMDQAMLQELRNHIFNLEKPWSNNDPEKDLKKILTQIQSELIFPPQPNN